MSWSGKRSEMIGSSPPISGTRASSTVRRSASRHRSGYGGVSRRHPSHTTGHTGPYHGGSIELGLHRHEDSGETKRIEHMISQGVLNRRVAGHAPESRR